MSAVSPMCVASADNESYNHKTMPSRPSSPAPPVPLFFGGTTPLLIIIALPLWLLQTLALRIASFLFCPSISLLQYGPLTWLCLFVESSFTAVAREDEGVASTSYSLHSTVSHSAEYNFAASVLSYIGSVGDRTRRVSMQSYSDRRNNHVQIDINSEEDSSETSENSSETGEESRRSRDEPRRERSVREATDRLRSEFTRLRSTIDQNEEAQNICTVFTALLPFVTLFALKFVFDNFTNLVELCLGYTCFLAIDSRIQAMVSAARTTFIGKTFLVTMLFLVLCSNFVFSVEDCDILNVLTFNAAGQTYHGFPFTLLCVLLTDNFVKLLTCAVKLLIQLMPMKMFSPHFKRRLFQCCEYISQVYRCCCPSVQWMYYFYGNEETSPSFYDYILLVVYIGLKVRELVFLAGVLFESLQNVFQSSTYGTTPSRQDLLQVHMCAICHDEFSSPTKLPCTHIFCVDCIDTWLDKETTCPMCRKTVEMKNNQWKTGATSKLIRFY